MLKRGGVALVLQAKAATLIAKRDALEIFFDALAAEQRMFRAFPLPLQCPDGPARIARQIAELAPLLVRQLRRPAGVPTLEQTGQAKIVPTPAPVLDTVKVRLEFVGHLLHCQTLRQPEHPLCPHPCAGMRMVDPHLPRRPSLLSAKIQSQPHVCHHPDRYRLEFDKKNLAIT